MCGPEVHSGRMPAGKLRAGHARPLLFVQRKTFRNPAVLYWPQRKGENAMLPILIVDDEKALSRMVEGVLQKEGFFRIYTAADCKSAELLTAENEFQMILLDVMLPDGDGFSLYKVMRETEKNRNTPVIFLSARDEDYARLKGLGLGADDYITKPFLPEELILRVKAVLKRCLFIHI